MTSAETVTDKPGAPPKRCGWCTGDALYEAYHDQEWGVPEYGRQALFERLVLEGMQAGLSWLTILKKRAHMQRVFYRFSIRKLSQAGEEDIAGWLEDPGIIRHRGKLEAMINNAQLADAQKDFSGYLWSFAPDQLPRRKTLKAVPTQTAESVAMSKALKKAGFKFVGPTICYAFMQSVGMVNDHVTPCFRQQECAALRTSSGA